MAPTRRAEPVPVFASVAGRLPPVRATEEPLVRVLAGDVGGTSARLAVVEVDGARVAVAREQKYPSHDYPGLAPIVSRFCAEAAETPERACFGIACPIVGEECRAPNLPWVINARELAAAIGVRRTRVINDFDAVGHGLPLMHGPDVVTLQAGEPAPRGAIALLGAGTGLGQGFLTWDGPEYRVHSSEGGHADFAPSGDLELDLARWLRAEYGHASWERVLSGPGLVNLYRFLVASGVAPESQAVRDEMTHGEPAAVVTRRGLEGSDPLCERALDLFARCFGAQAGNVALTVLASGGVYLAGGIAPRIAAKLQGAPFLEAFRSKGRLSAFLAKVPVHVVVNPNVGLLGAAVAAARQV